VIAGPAVRAGDEYRHNCAVSNTMVLYAID
jgi:hypothetical protein